MDGDQSRRALARIDAALERLERVIQRVASSDPKAEAKYRDLRGKVGHALGGLDILIRDLSR